LGEKLQDGKAAYSAAVDQTVVRWSALKSADRISVLQPCHGYVVNPVNIAVILQATRALAALAVTPPTYLSQLPTISELTLFLQLALFRVSASKLPLFMGINPDTR